MTQQLEGPSGPPAATLATALPEPEALYFNVRGSAAFGWYHAASEPRIEHGVVLCNALGEEGILAHRTLRHLAEKYAQSGVAALRFDYLGTGDSAGLDTDPDRVAAWMDSIEAGIDELRLRTGLERVSLVGVRLGATLAFVTAARRADVDGVIAWSPCLTGKGYVREMRALRRMGVGHGIPPTGQAAMLETGDEEAGGFVLTKATVAELGEIDLLKLSARPAANALLLARQDLSRPAEQLARHLEHLQVKVEVQRLRGFPKMMDEPHRSEVPDQFCESSVGWVTRGRKVTPEPVKSAAIPRETSIVLPGMGRRSQIRERPVKFNRLFGVLGAPVDAPGERARTAILFLNAGGVPHMGPNRMYVALAREWASLGFTTLRFDVGGLGDSVWLGTVAGRMYSREVVGDARAALSFVRDTCGIDRTVLVGLCSGAYVAFYTALEMPGAITAQVLLNPQTFNFRPGESLDVRVLGPRSFARQSNWLQLTRGQIGFRDIRGALRRGVERIGARASFLPRQPALTRNGLNLARAFHSIASVGTQTLLVYSRDDPGLEYFRARVGRDLRKLTATGRFRIELVDGADHTFTPAWSQRHIARLLTDFALSV